MKNPYDALLEMIPKKELEQALSQDYCELEPDFLCFAENYACVADFVPHDYAILDFGSYMMAQAYFFKDFIGGYWGIDNYGKSELFHDLKPFLLEGCKNKAVPMVSTSIQEAVGILKNTIPKDLKVYAICSGVPDKEAVEEVRRNFPNHAIMYPGEESDFSGIFAEEIAKRREEYAKIIRKDEEMQRIARNSF